MTLLSDLRHFLLREKGWTLLFVALLGIYAFTLLSPRQGEKEASSGVLEELRQAELRIKDEIHEAGGIQEFLVKNPKLFIAFNLFSLVLLTAVALGIFVNLLWFLRPGLRSGLQVTDGPPEARHWGLGTLFKVVLLFITLALGSGVALSLLRVRLFPHWNPNVLSLLHTTLVDFLCFGLIVLFLARQGGSWRELGFRQVALWKDIGVGLAGYVAVLPFFFLILVGVALLAYFLNYEPPPHPLVEIFLEEEKRAPAVIMYSIFLACVAGPFFEEIFFRGFCYPAFKRRWGRNWALVSSSAFFALIHQNLFAFWPIFVLGLGLGYLYEKRGTLVPSIVLHMVHNSVFISYFFLAKEVLLRSS